ncbi:MAG: HD domain-containing phosphohydrolase [Betaproteobacteria bacterium]
MMETPNLTVSTDDLRMGMFVAELDQPWLGTPFPLEGLFIDEQEQLDELRRLCREVVIDLRRSAAESVRHLPGLPRDSSGAETGRNSARVSVARHVRSWWDKQLAALFGRRTVEPPPKPRIQGMPAGVELVVWRDTKAFDQAMGPARHVYRDIEATMKTVMVDLSEKREISAEALTGAASELVESVAVNPEAMMWLTRMRQRNERTYMHGVEVAIYMVTLGRHLGFPRDHLTNFCMIGLLLDVGMTRVDNALLERAGPLSPDELTEVRRHVDFGLEILANSPGIDPTVREAIAQHHERIDGSGYPRGLLGHQIAFAARMAALADSFAALTTHRPHAEPLSAFNAMKVLFNDAGTLFAEPLVEQFVQAVGLFPVGSLVELSTGEVAAVVSHNKVRRLKPRVLILADRNKKVLDSPSERNLLLDPTDADGAQVRILRGLSAGAYGVNPRDFFLT